jgi:hypothetical protein
MDSYYAKFESNDLWERVNDESAYLFVRTPMIFELARRGDNRILDFCEDLISSGDIEEWFVGLRILAHFKNDAACERFIELFQEAPLPRRIYIAKYMGMVVNRKFKTEFKKIAMTMVGCGTLEVTGWTESAIACLKSTCKRLGIHVIDSIKKFQKDIGYNDPSKSRPTTSMRKLTS